MIFVSILNSLYVILFHFLLLETLYSSYFVLRMMILKRSIDRKEIEKDRLDRTSIMSLTPKGY